MPRGDIANLITAHASKAKAAKYVPLFAPVSEKECLSTGCSVLNLVFSGRVNGGIKDGCPVHVVGDSDTGKSLVGLTILAEASRNKRFDKYGLWKDDAESACSFPIREMFGAELARRLKHPGPDGESSYYIEDFYFNTFRHLQEGPGVFLLDSMDGLESHAGTELFEENAKRQLAGKELKQSFTDGKAKKNSENLRKLRLLTEKTCSHLIIVSQTRDNIDPTSMSPKTHAGGKALKFNVMYQLWLANGGSLTKSIHGKEHSIGTLARCKVSKNHVTGKYASFMIPIYYGYGVDDEQCSIRWLSDPTGGGIWKVGSGILTTRAECGLDKTYPLREFLGRVRVNSPKYEPDLRAAFDEALQKGWDEMEAQLRKPGRYGEKHDIEEMVE